MDKNEQKRFEYWQAYKNARDERLGNIGQGDNWNPWLAMKMMYNENQLNSHEQNPYSNNQAREASWLTDMEQAQKLAKLR